MATSVGTLVAKLTANTAEFQAGLKRAQASLGKFKQAAQKVGLVGGVMAAAVGGIGYHAMKAASQFESSMARVKAVSQASGAEFGKLQSKALGLASSTKYTASQVSEGMQYMAMAGMKTSQILSGMPSVLTLASAGAIELGSAADIVTNIMAGFGMQSEQLPGAVDKIAKAITSANVDVSGLGQAFKYVGPMARSAGISFDETAAAIALMGNAGMQGSMAGRGLAMAITQMIKPSDDAKKAMAELGVSTTDAQGHILPLTDIIRQLAPHADKTAHIMRMFGQNAGPKMAALVGMGAEAMVDLTEKIRKSSGFASGIAKAEMATFGGQMLILQSQIERLSIDMGKALMPTMRKLVGYAQNLVGYFISLPASTKNMIATIGLLVTTLGAGAAAFGLLVTGVAGAFTAFTTLGAVLLGIAPVALPIIVILGGLVTIFGAIRTAILETDITFKDIFRYLEESTGNVSGWFSDGFAEVKDIVVGAALTILDTLQPVFKFIAAGIEKLSGGKIKIEVPDSEEIVELVGKAAEDVADASIDALKAIGTVVAEDALETAKMIKEGAKTLGKEAIGLANSVGDSFKSGIEGLKAVLGTLSEEVIEALGLRDLVAKLSAGGGGGGDGGTISAALSTDSTGGDAAATAKGLGPAAQKFADAGADLASQLGHAGQTLLAAIKQFASGDVLGGILTVTVGLISQTKGFQMIMKTLGQLFSYVGKIIDPILQALNPLLQALIELAILFIMINYGFVTLGPIIEIFAASVEAVAKTIHWVSKMVVKIWNWMIDVIAGLLGKISDDWAKAAKKFKLYISDMFVDATKDGSAGMGGFTDHVAGATDAIGEMGDAAKEVVEALLNVPEGFKIAAARFNALDPTTMTESTATVVPTEMIPAGSVIIEQINVDAVDPEDFANQLEQIQQHRGFMTFGTSFRNNGRFATASRGA